MRPNKVGFINHTLKKINFVPPFLCLLCCSPFGALEILINDILTLGKITYIYSIKVSDLHIYPSKFKFITHIHIERERERERELKIFEIYHCSLVPSI